MRPPLLLHIQHSYTELPRRYTMSFCCCSPLRLMYLPLLRLLLLRSSVVVLRWHPSNHLLSRIHLLTHAYTCSLTESSTACSPTHSRMCREAACSTGYSPLINFEVADLDSTIPELLMQGASSAPAAAFLATSADAYSLLILDSEY